MEKNKSFVATFAILMATFLWGMTFAFIKDAVATLNPFNFLFWRFAIASLLLACFFYKKIKINRQILLYGLLLGLFLGGTVIFQTMGLRYTTASTASFITGFAVVLVALFESLLNQRFPSQYLILATFLAITGIGLITLENGIAVNQGDLWVLLCAFCFASYIIFAGKASQIKQTFSLTLIQTLFICAVVGSFSFLSGTFSVPQHANVWIAILFCSIFASIIAFSLQLEFQKYVSPTKTAIIFALEPVFATLTAAIYLHERITIQFFIGALLIFSAILISERRSKQKVLPQE